MPRRTATPISVILERLIISVGKLEYEAERVKGPAPGERREMWINRRTDYATRAVLALAVLDDGQPHKLQELAERTATRSPCWSRSSPSCAPPGSCARSVARPAATA